MLARYERLLTQFEVIDARLRRMPPSLDVSDMIEQNELMRAALECSIALCRGSILPRVDPEKSGS